VNDHRETSPAQAVIDLPAAVTGPFEVYLNGILQQPGVDYQVDDRTLVFPRTLVSEIKMSKLDWVKVTFGIGNYAKHDTVDIAYRHEGRALVATGLQPRGLTPATDA
jgi:hypothetical protein